MGKKFKSITELSHYIENMVNIALDTEVKEESLETLVSYASDDIYTYPASGAYKRRHSFEDKSKYNVDRSQNMKLIITPMQEFNPFRNGENEEAGFSMNASGGNKLAGLVNYGDGWGGYEYDWSYVGPRPFLDHAKEDLGNGVFKQALKVGLEELGINAK